MRLPVLSSVMVLVGEMVDALGRAKLTACEPYGIGWVLGSRWARKKTVDNNLKVDFSCV